MKIFVTILIIIFLPLSLFSNYCHFCGNYINNMVLCPYCNHSKKTLSTNIIICPVCESKNSALNKYCTNCGYPLNFINNEFKTSVIEFNNGNYENSLNILEKIIEKDKFFYLAYKYKIELLFKTEKLSKYYSEIKSRLILNPEDIVLLYVMGILYFKNNEKNNAIKTLNKALEIYPQFSEVYCELYEITGDISNLEKAIKFKPSFYLPYIAYAERLINEEKYDEAEEKLNIAITLFPYDYKLWFLKAVAKFKTGDLSNKTLQYFLNSLKYNPDFYFSNYYIGKMLYLNKEFLNAERRFKEILLNKQLDLEIRMLSNFYLGLIYDRINNFDLLNLKSENADNQDKYYSEVFKIFPKIDKFKHITEDESNKILLLKNLYENYQSGIIKKLEFLEKRREILFTTKE